MNDTDLEDEETTPPASPEGEESDDEATPPAGIPEGEGSEPTEGE